MGTKFIHTHLHSDGSLLDGFVQPKEYVEYAKKIGMSALAITDHGSLNNSYKHYRECIKNGIKPIVGCEFYTHESIGQVDGNGKRIDGKKDHLILLVKNEIGWKNMLKLNHLAFSEKNFYYKPTVSLNDVLNNCDGLIITSACIGSRINRLLLDDKDEEAEYWIQQFQHKLKDDFYFEIQMNEIKEQKKANTKLIELSGKYGIKILLTNDVHYIYKDDAKIQDAVISIAQKTTLSDPDRFSIDARHSFFALEEDFYKFNEKFGYGYKKDFIDRCLMNTLEIEKKVDFHFPKTKNYPMFNVEQSLIGKYALKEDANLKYNLMVKLCMKGLKDRLASEQIDNSKMTEYQSRLKKELGIIKKMGYIDYFLIVWDIVAFAKEKGIRMGVARGSVGGCLVAYLLGITNLDPIRWNTILERFLSVDRCLHKDTKILREGGIIDKVNNIKIGDKVVTRNGIDEVIGVYKSISDDIYEINGIKCTGNHKWIIIRDNKEIECMTKDLKETDELIEYD